MYGHVKGIITEGGLDTKITWQSIARKNKIEKNK